MIIVTVVMAAHMLLELVQTTKATLEELIRVKVPFNSNISLESSPQSRIVQDKTDRSEKADVG